MSYDYKIVPYNPSINIDGSVKEIASEMEAIIQARSAAGWEYIRVEQVTTFIRGTSGCFGYGAKPGYNQVLHFMVFKKES